MNNTINSYNNNNNGVVEVEPKIHMGPFNTQCIFMENAKSLMSKISGYLAKNNLKYSEI